MSLELTLFSFDIEITQDEGGMFWPKTVKGKGPWVHKIVPTLNRLCIINGPLHSLLVPAFQFRLSLSCTKTRRGESMATIVNKIELK